MFKLSRLFQATCVVALGALVFMTTAYADSVPTIMPADPNTVPGHDQISKGFALFLIGVVLFLTAVAIISLVKLIRSIGGDRGIALGAGGAFIAAVIGISLISTQGTGFLNGWTGYF